MSDFIPNFFHLFSMMNKFQTMVNIFISEQTLNNASMLEVLSFANTLTIIFVFLKSILSSSFSRMVEFFCQKQ